jgi:hypothetical protein
MQSAMHLLVSVFVTDNGLRRYETGFARTDTDSRLDVFLTAMNSARALPWSSVRIFFELDGAYARYTHQVRDTLSVWFPGSTITSRRLEYFSDWNRVSRDYELSSCILLNTNDDHAFVPGSQGPLLTLADEVCGVSDGRAVGQVTHFSEAWSDAASPWSRGAMTPRGNLRVPVRWTVGTCLVTTDFFRSWWGTDFTNGSRIVRPDNPFGPSVEFRPAPSFVPTREIMRHMDGYSHVGLKRPLAPLRSTVKLRAPAQVGSLTHRAWQVGDWPKRLYAWSGSQYPDIRRTSNLSATTSLDFRGDVAALQAAWAHRISSRHVDRLIPNRGRFPRVYRGGVCIVTACTPTVLTRWPRFTMDQTLGRLLGLAAKRLPAANAALVRSGMFGWRAVIVTAVKRTLLFDSMQKS